MIGPVAIVDPGPGLVRDDADPGTDPGLVGPYPGLIDIAEGKQGQMRILSTNMLPIGVVAIERKSSIAFLDAVFDTQARGDVALPTEDPDAVSLVQIVVRDRIRCTDGGGWYARQVTPRHDAAAAQISLTSGTTGTPKPILLSHGALADVTDRLVDIQRLTADVREYVGVPVHYSFGFGRIRAIAAVGGQAYLPMRGFRVDELAEMLARGEVNALSAVPTLLRVILAQRDRIEPVGDRLRWLEIGSQAMSVEEKRAIQALFPNARIVQHYGLTEASRSTFLLLPETQSDALGSVGQATGNVEVRITDDGLIAIRGPHIADGVVTSDGLVSLTDQNGWLITRDLGRMQGDFLYFEGRADHLLNVGGIKIGAEYFEAQLLSRLRDLGSSLADNGAVAVGGGQDALRGEIVVVAHRSDLDGAELDTLSRASVVVARAMGIGDAFALCAMPTIPRTDTDKIIRQDIRAAFAQGRATTVPAEPIGRRPADPAAGVRALFGSIFGSRAESDESSFVSLGGDSLHYVSMVTGLEDLVPELPDNWDEISIAALAALAERQAGEGLIPATASAKLPQNLDSIRGLACAMIVALHVVGVAPDEGLRLPASSAWHQVMNVFNLVRLPLFTAMAGFLYAAMPATRRGYGDFIARKIRQLVPPILFATLVFWGLRTVTYGDGGSLFWAYVDGYRHIWYLHALLLIFATVALVDVAVSARWNSWAAWAVLGAVVMLSYHNLPDIPVMHFRNAMFLLPFFLFGIILYRVPLLLRSNAILAAALVIGPALLIAERFAARTIDAIDPLGLLRWVCGAAIVVILVRLFPRIRALQWIAIYSFTIYLWHPAANAVLRKLLWEVGIKSTGLLFAIGLAAGLLIPVVIHVVAQRFPRLSLMVIGR